MPIPHHKSQAKAESVTPLPDSDQDSSLGLKQVFRRWDLISLSVSSVGPMFSVAATGGVMAAQAGWYTIPAIFLISIPFLISGFSFRLLNYHFPHSGASYHWSAKVLGKGISRFQAWVLILAYFASIPPIIIPASSYTLSLIAPHYVPTTSAELAASAFWVLFAAIPLLGGGRPTARITQVFLLIEMISLLGFTIIGIIRWPQIHVPIHFGPVPVGGILVVAVVAATILDGWEIDSYASEEAQRPRNDPGVGGIIGAFMALGFYAILYPLMMGETPLNLLANATNPLAIWSDRLIPQAPWIMLIPVLASTAGGLWLTSFILTRALYAMGREGIVPSPFAKLSNRQVPHVAIIIILGMAFTVTGLQTIFSSLSSFFSLVLSGAGFFLVVEFFLDSLTASVFLTTGHRKLADFQMSPHAHSALLVGSIISATMFGGLIVAFFIYGPKIIGSSIDKILLVLLALGVVFSWLKRRNGDQVEFAGKDITTPNDL